jgi:hypothetical protein
LLVQPPGASGKVDLNGANGNNKNINTMNPAAIRSITETLREKEPEQAALVIKEIRENFPRYAPMAAQLGGKFMSTLCNTASSNIE